MDFEDLGIIKNDTWSYGRRGYITNGKMLLRMWFKAPWGPLTTFWVSRGLWVNGRNWKGQSRKRSINRRVQFSVNSHKGFTDRRCNFVHTGEKLLCDLAKVKWII